MKLLIIGDGGHSRVVQDIIAVNGRDNVVAVLDDKYSVDIQKNGMIYGPIASVFNLLKRDTRVLVAIGNNSVRQTIVQELNLPDDSYYSVIHPTAVISRSAYLEVGIVVMPYAVINANVKVGAHSIVNTRAILEHDNDIGSFNHVSPNATLTGGVTTGEGVHVGSSATVIPGKHLGRWSIIGAASTVIEHIPPFSTAVGSPTRIIGLDAESIMEG